MKRLIRSEGYARARLVSAALFVILGAVVIARTLAVTGASFSAIPACALGGAMIALGVLRYRDYFANRVRR
jgi:predicted membrane channel-forming protein YqfA (hemolysin III family)